MNNDQENRVDKMKQKAALELVNKRRKEILDFPANIPDKLLKELPEFKREETIMAIKSELIEEKKKDILRKIVNLNSLSKDAVNNDLNIRLKGYTRELEWNRARLKQMKSEDKEWVDAKGNTTYEYEVENAIDVLENKIQETSLQLGELK